MSVAPVNDGHKSGERTDTMTRDVFQCQNGRGSGRGLFEILAGWVARPGWLGTPPPTVKCNQGISYSEKRKYTYNYEIQ